MILYHHDLVQGTDEWLAARCGLLTASEMKHILTPTLKVASNEKERSHLYELLAQRITRYVEPSYIGDDMLRGMMDEVDAVKLYEEHHAPVERVGFVTNDQWGFTIGYSPDGLVGDDGLVEAKSRRQKFQVETFVVHVLEGTKPADYILQVQTGMLVTGRAWCDLISYSAGLPMAVMRCEADPVVQQAILNAAAAFEDRLRQAWIRYDEATLGAPKTERRAPEQEMVV
jgi:hypothetical protein